MLRGLRLGEVRSRTGDRVLVLDFGTTSRFGVTRGVKLVAELIPRFGNLVLLRDGDVIAAAKQFSPAENEARSVGVGGPVPAAAAATRNRACRKCWPTSLRRGRRRAREEALLAHSARRARDRTALRLSRRPEAGRRARRAARAIRRTSTRARRAAVCCRSSPKRARRAPAAARAMPANASARRCAIASRNGCATPRAEIAQVTARRDDAAGRDALRAAGDALYTYGIRHPGRRRRSFVTPDEAALDDRARSRTRREGERRAAISRAIAKPPTRCRISRSASRCSKRNAHRSKSCAFETERGDMTTLAEVDGRASIASKAAKPRRRAPRRKTSRAPLRVERPSGARIFVGRSPRENLEVTFKHRAARRSVVSRARHSRFARRAASGARANRPPTPTSIAPPISPRCTAARRTSPRVEIDYTERKYVRKQRDAAPGMVWYTNARTRVGRPDAAELS